MPAALVPVKSLRDSKTRLAAVFSPEQRHQLTLAMLDDVLDAALAAGFWPVTVVSADAGVLTAAVDKGARGLLEPSGTPGLNGAIEHGLNVLGRHGAESAVILLPDVPSVAASDLRTIAGLLRDHQVVIVPSADGGTNALGLTLPAPIRVAFGPDSAARHSQGAWLAEVYFAVRLLASMERDVDDPAGVEQFLATSAGGRTAELLQSFGGVVAVA
jgi:2-phospho-L-lactate/phosphoenolpyruvate guanylyltransferase